MMSQELLDFEPAERLALGVYSTAISFAEMAGSDDLPTGEELVIAHDYLEQMLVEAPLTANLLIEAANQQAELTELVGSDGMGELAFIARSLSQREGGVQFLQNFAENFNPAEVDDDTAIVGLKKIFAEDLHLMAFLNSESGLSELWHQFVLSNLKLAIVAARGEANLV